MSNRKIADDLQLADLQADLDSMLSKHDDQIAIQIMGEQVNPDARAHTY
jgi:hypothetical protein